MTEIVIKTYDYLRRHRALCLTVFLLLSVLLVVQTGRLAYKEDISDFLPLEGNYQQAVKVYQDISGGSRILTIFQHRDTAEARPDRVVEAVELMLSTLEAEDTAHVVQNIIAQADMDKMAEVTAFTYQHIPYFLTDSDYRRMDSLMADDGYIARQLEQDKQMLLFPDGGMLSENIQRDPLNLFTPVVSLLQDGQGGFMQYELYDGYIFSADLKRAVVIIDSPYGGSETENNAKLLSMLQAAADSVAQQVPDVSIHFTGGPPIAVGNASQIKTDSLLSITLAALLVLLLLYCALRSWRNLLLIALSIGWGWLFAIALLSVVHQEVSIIVIGISSIILGIAVNYPLHLIDHLGHTPDVRHSLREIVMPLLVGNITTVGAFLTLVPLHAVALRDLGLFSAFLLIGTIIFVLVFLPHAARKTSRQSITFLDRMGDISLEDKPWVFIPVIILTVILGYFSWQTSFDTNMSHINFMTDEQQADMAYLQRMNSEAPTTRKIYVVSSGTTPDKALDNHALMQPLFQQLSDSGKIGSIFGCSHFITSTSEQQQRIDRWNDWTKRHAATIRQQLGREAVKAGFAADSFDEFLHILEQEYHPLDVRLFQPLTQSVFASCFSNDTLQHNYQVVDVLSVSPSAVQSVSRTLNEAGIPDSYCFDVESMNSDMASNLSDNFNYIGWACGFIVFIFLWFSLGNIELALLSFLPMAVSWIWILGLMSLFGIQFNIVNVILATFIFGQGDDYTIFMTEGSCYEYAYQRKMLSSYKHSIMLSALIMFIGIGSLIVARHPALHSLAEVTIVGMFSVVLMAYIFPPLIFKWLVSNGHGFRRRPLTLRNILFGADESPFAIVADRYRYRGIEIATDAHRRLRYWRRHADELPTPHDGQVTLDDEGWGETALLVALSYPQATVHARIADDDRRTVAVNAADGMAPNLHITTTQP